jgi:hypothetical protein
MIEYRLSEAFSASCGRITLASCFLGCAKTQQEGAEASGVKLNENILFNTCNILRLLKLFFSVLLLCFEVISSHVSKAIQMSHM